MPLECLIISGRSGSGKSTALQALEDMGYYCVDNMPLPLLPDLLAQFTKDASIRRIAVGIDARNLPHQLQSFDQVVSKVKQSGNTCHVLYLDASDQVLQQRFDATRRRHPLSSQQRSLSEAIQHESDILTGIRSAADIHIDTSRLDVHSLRTAIRNRIEGHADNILNVQVMSFAFKHGVPQDADLMFDVRILPNPYWDADLRAYSGNDQPVIDFLDSKAACQEMLDDIAAFVLRWLPAYQENDRSYLTIAIGCTGGHHRSVYIANRLATALGEHLPHLHLRHRDCPLNKDSHD